MKNASRHVVFSFGWSLGLSASANIRKLSKFKFFYTKNKFKKLNIDASEILKYNKKKITRKVEQGPMKNELKAIEILIEYQRIKNKTHEQKNKSAWG